MIDATTVCSEVRGALMGHLEINTHEKEQQAPIKEERQVIEEYIIICCDLL
jgi:hypothetical protein